MARKKTESVVTASVPNFTARAFDVRTAAQYLSCRTFFIRNLIRSGRLPFALLGKKHIIDRNDLDNFFESQKQIIKIEGSLLNGETEVEKEKVRA